MFTNACAGPNKIIPIIIISKFRGNKFPGNKNVTKNEFINKPKLIVNLLPKELKIGETK